MPNIKKITFVGGTHGDELIGVELVRKYQRHNPFQHDKNIKIDFLFGNPAAIKERKRFIDQDLNQCFLQKDLDNPELNNTEQIRAKELQALLGPRSNPKTDFIIDFHSCNSNMGHTVVLSLVNPVSLTIANYLKKQFPDIHFLHFTVPSQILHPSLVSLTDYHMGFEFGSLPSNLVHYDAFCHAEAMIAATIDAIRLINQDPNFQDLTPIEVFDYCAEIKYPTNENKERIAMCHPELEKNTYQLLKKGAPIFQTHENETITYQGEPDCYPIFINESANHYKNTAFALTKKKIIGVESDDFQHNARSP